jgi:hypothetical protein
VDPRISEICGMRSKGRRDELSVEVARPGKMCMELRHSLSYTLGNLDI